MIKSNKSKKLAWENQKRKLKDLIPAAYNPRKMTDQQKADLTSSILEFNEVDPIIINTDGKIIGGHMRYQIYQERNVKEVDVRVPNRTLTDEEEKRLNLRLNKNVGMWDPEMLEANFDVSTLLDVGFGEEELSSMFDDMEIIDDQFVSDQAVEEAKTTKIKQGDIIQLGEHRLMCGDSADPKQVAKLMDGAKAEMIYSDPPYNIGLSYESGMGTKKKYQGKYKDKKKDEAYLGLIRETIENALENALENAHFFYWCDEKYIWLIQTLYQQLGITNKRVCLWIKNNQNPVPQVAFNKVYEPCVYGVTGRPFLNPNYKAFNEVLNKEVESGNQLVDDIFDLFNIWLVKRDATKDYEHPTQKPLNLHEKPIKRCTGPGAVVMDLFAGSGSTLMACEQMKRISYNMEIDPIFCQVIVNRWEDYTGKKSKKL